VCVRAHVCVCARVCVCVSVLVCVCKLGRRRKKLCRWRVRRYSLSLFFTHTHTTHTPHTHHTHTYLFVSFSLFLSSFWISVHFLSFYLNHLTFSLNSRLTDSSSISVCQKRTKTKVDTTWHVHQRYGNRVHDTHTHTHTNTRAHTHTNTHTYNTHKHTHTH